MCGRSPCGPASRARPISSNSPSSPCRKATSTCRRCWSGYAAPTRRSSLARTGTRRPVKSTWSSATRPLVGSRRRRVSSGGRSGRPDRSAGSPQDPSPSSSTRSAPRTRPGRCEMPARGPTSSSSARASGAWCSTRWSTPLRPASCACRPLVGARAVELDAAALNRRLVLENDVVFGTVNADRRHYEAAVEALVAADPDWLDRIIRRRVLVVRRAEALERRDDDVKTVLSFDDGQPQIAAA